jgi:hypothetical protein
MDQKKGSFVASGGRREMVGIVWRASDSPNCRHKRLPIFSVDQFLKKAIFQIKF